jgi:hypothetical protein
VRRCEGASRGGYLRRHLGSDDGHAVFVSARPGARQNAPPRPTPIPAATGLSPNQVDRAPGARRCSSHTAHDARRYNFRQDEIDRLAPSEETCAPPWPGSALGQARVPVARQTGKALCAVDAASIQIGGSSEFLRMSYCPYVAAALLHRSSFTRPRVMCPRSRARHEPHRAAAKPPAANTSTLKKSTAAITLRRGFENAGSLEKFA